MGLTEVECKEKDGEIYDLADTNRKICVLPDVEEKREKRKESIFDRLNSSSKVARWLVNKLFRIESKKSPLMKIAERIGKGKREEG